MTAHPATPVSEPERWPSLPLAAWQDTYATLHRWTQVVGKIRLALTPLVNHWWNTTLYVTARGLTTSPMPYQGRTVQIDFDFLDHALRIETSDGRRREIALAPKSVADFYREVMAALSLLGVGVQIWTTPVEVEDRTPFEQDRRHASYDPAYARRCWQVLVQADRVLQAFRARFVGKCSPVHFFWGSFDLAVTRFSGRRAPDHARVPNVSTRVVREAYSHEVSSCGFWPGGNGAEAAFYAYAYPEPPGFKDHPARPDAAFHSQAMGEFLLPYEAVRRSPNPDAALLDFLQTTYQAAADRAHWDRPSLERASAIG